MNINHSYRYMPNNYRKLSNNIRQEKLYNRKE